MKIARTVLLAVVGSALIATGAIAADLPRAPTVVAPPPPPPMAAPAFDWSGMYVGAYGSYFSGDPFILLGVQAGYNMVRNHFLAGIEAQAGAYYAFPSIGFHGSLNGRLGFILGERFLIYGEAGVGAVLPGAFIWTGVAGAEVALGSTWSIFVEGGLLGELGVGPAGYLIQAGVNWHR
jgi:opacity protein-like surface antigen